jgi:hypothetical protein
MSKNITLIRRSFEESCDVGIISICEYSSIWKVIDEKVLGPEGTEHFAATHFIGSHLFGKELRQPATRLFGLLSVVTICPCFLWMALKAVDEHKTSKYE